MKNGRRDFFRFDCLRLRKRDEDEERFQLMFFFFFSYLRLQKPASKKKERVKAEADGKQIKKRTRGGRKLAGKLASKTFKTIFFVDIFILKLLYYI